MLDCLQLKWCFWDTKQTILDLEHKGSNSKFSCGNKIL